MFHWREGWFFARNRDGSVQITKHQSADPNSPAVFEAEIPAAEWASLVARLLPESETALTYRLVRAMHGGD